MMETSQMILINWISICPFCLTAQSWKRKRKERKRERDRHRQKEIPIYEKSHFQVETHQQIARTLYLSVDIHWALSLRQFLCSLPVLTLQKVSSGWRDRQANCDYSGDSMSCDIDGRIGSPRTCAKFRHPEHRFDISAKQPFPYTTKIYVCWQ